MCVVASIRVYCCLFGCPRACLLVGVVLLVMLAAVLFLCCAFAFTIAVCFPVMVRWFVSVMPVVLSFVLCVV